MKKWIATAGTALLIGLGMLISAQNTRADAKIPVVVSIPPQKYFVEAIGGSHVNVVVMVTPGQAPETFEPTPAQMKGLAAAKIYFAGGVPFETAWLQKFLAVNPKMAVVRTDKGIEKKPINRHEEQGPVSGIEKPVFHDDHHDHYDNDHQYDHHHDHGATDPHTWLSPPLVMIQAGHILDGLVKAAPGLQAEFEANYALFIKQLTDLDIELRRLFTDHAGERFLVFHPSWGYFADAYRLRQVSIEIDGKEPKARELNALIVYARDAGIRTIFIQPQFSTRQAEIIAAEIKGSLVHADPLAENWMENIRSVATSLKESLR